MNTSGIILAGGKSRRMGKDKGHCLINGRSLLSYALDALSDICNPILISANSEDYKSYGYEVLPDVISGVGPIGGIYSALSNSKTEMNVILSCDTPLVGRKTIEYVLSQTADHQAVVPLFKGLPEPLCAYYRKDCLDHLHFSIKSKQYKLMEILKGLDTKFLPIDPTLDFYHKELFANVNDQKELLRIEKLLKKV